MKDSILNITIRQFKDIIDTDYISFLRQCKKTVTVLLSVAMFNDGRRLESLIMEEQEMHGLLYHVFEECKRQGADSTMKDYLGSLGPIDKTFFMEIITQLPMFFSKCVMDLMQNFVSMYITADYQFQLRVLSKIVKVKKVAVLEQRHIQANVREGV